MNLLIIGAKGFIGTHLFNYFFNKKEFNVFGADILEFSSEMYFQISDSNSLDKLFESNKFNFCINASGAAQVQNSFDNPIYDFTLNSFNVFKILESIKNYSPSCKFINLSSAAVYGNPKKLPISECDSFSPISPYGFHKLVSEFICLEFFKIYKIQTVSLRLFSVYGEGLRKQLFWDLYIKYLQRTENKIILFGTGNESRDFIYIFDLCVAIESVIKNLDFKGQVINISSGIETSIRYAAELFISLFDSDVKIEYTNNNKVGDPLNWRADITELVKLGFKPKFTIEEGIFKIYKWINVEV